VCMYVCPAACRRTHTSHFFRNFDFVINHCKIWIYNICYSIWRCNIQFFNIWLFNIRCCYIFPFSSCITQVFNLTVDFSFNSFPFLSLSLFTIVLSLFIRKNYLKTLSPSKYKHMLLTVRKFKLFLLWDYTMIIIILYNVGFIAIRSDKVILSLRISHNFTT